MASDIPQGEPIRAAIVIDTPEGIERFRKIALVHAIGIFLDTGMRVSRNFPTVKKIREWYPDIVTARTYAGAKDQLERYLNADNN